MRTIDTTVLADLSSHTRRLGIKRFFQSMGYERCAELPLVVRELRPQFATTLKYLDIGSGESVLPSYILKNSVWDVTCLDKFSSVQVQRSHAERFLKGVEIDRRLHIVEKDFLQEKLTESSFDVITNISVIEHFEELTDQLAMQKSAQLLKPGGKYILTTLINEGNFKEFFLEESVYGAEYKTKPVFFQRHYDVEGFNKRIVGASGLREEKRTYFGEYGFRFADRFIDVPWPWKPMKALYQWATPSFAKRFLTYSNTPISLGDMHMFTASGVFVVLERAQ